MIYSGEPFLIVLMRDVAPTTLRPSIKPLSLSPWLKPTKRTSFDDPGDPLLRNPITGIAGCCARAASGRAATVPPRIVMNARRFIADHVLDALHPSLGDLTVQVQAVSCRSWVKMRNARREQMFSAVHPTTDIAQRSRHVGFVPPIAAVGRPLLYHLVGALLDGQRHVDAKGLGGLEVHHEFKLDWLFDR